MIFEIDWLVAILHEIGHSFWSSIKEIFPGVIENNDHLNELLADFFCWSWINPKNNKEYKIFKRIFYNLCKKSLLNLPDSQSKKETQQLIQLRIFLLEWLINKTKISQSDKASDFIFGNDKFKLLKNSTGPSYKNVYEILGIIETERLENGKLWGILIKLKNISENENFRYPYFKKIIEDARRLIIGRSRGISEKDTQHFWLELYWSAHRFLQEIGML